VFLTRPPRKPSEDDPVRLACIRHAASVDPEPGSNSPPKCCLQSPRKALVMVLICWGHISSRHHRLPPTPPGCPVRPRSAVASTPTTPPSASRDFSLRLRRPVAAIPHAWNSLAPDRQGAQLASAWLSALCWRLSQAPQTSSRRGPDNVTRSVPSCQGIP
jgi:hypothetical protein